MDDSIHGCTILQEPGTILLTPIELSVENIGSLRNRDYRPLRPVIGLPAVPLSDAQQTTSCLDRGRRPQSAGMRAVESAHSQTSELEAVFLEMLDELQSANKDFARERSGLRTLQCEADALSVYVGL